MKNNINKLKKIIFLLGFILVIYKKDAFSEMKINIGLDYGLDNVKSDLFIINNIPRVNSIAGTPNENIPLLTRPIFSKYQLNQKFASLYGGNIFFGYMMDNGLGASFGVLYSQSKIEASEDKTSSLKPIVIGGMINLDYSLDLGLIVYPYISIGAGMGRIDIKGQFNQTVNQRFPDTAGTNPEPNQDLNLSLDIKNFTKNKFIYQAEAGLLLKNFGVGYKFFGSMDINDSEEFNGLKVNLYNLSYPSSAAHNVGSKDFKFGTIENKNHILTIFMKFVI